MSRGIDEKEKADKLSREESFCLLDGPQPTVTFHIQMYMHCKGGIPMQFHLFANTL